MIKDPENYVNRREDVVLNINDAPEGYDGPEGAYRKGEYKIILHPGADGWIEPSTGENISVEKRTRSKNYYLFNVVEDPEEREDLSSALPDVLHELTQIFNSLHDEMVPADVPENSSGGLQDGVWVTGWC